MELIYRSTKLESGGEGSPSDMRTLTSRGRRDFEKSSTASTPVTNPSRSESYIGKIDSYFDLSCPDMAYGSVARGGSGATPNVLPDRGKPCETEPAGGGGAFCILASGRGRVLSISNRDAEIGIPGDAYQQKTTAGHPHTHTQGGCWRRSKPSWHSTDVLTYRHCCLGTHEGSQQNIYTSALAIGVCSLPGPSR